jgi:hypothetical protein
MDMRTSIRYFAMAAACCAFALPAQAQSAPGDHVWGHGTTISASTGVSADSSRTGPVIGGSAGWEITPRFAIDGSGAWAEFGSGSHAFTGAIKLRAHLTDMGAAVPFLQAGVAFHRASFDRGGAGAPEFYARRMSRSRPEETRTFTDPALALGGGFNVSITRTMKLRPDVEALIIARGGRQHVVTSVRLHFVYVFEDRPVTPSKRSR